MSHSLSQVMRELATRADACADTLTGPHCSVYKAGKARRELRLISRELRSWAGFSELFPQTVPPECVETAKAAFHAMDQEVAL